MRPIKSGYRDSNGKVAYTIFYVYGKASTAMVTHKSSQDKLFLPETPLLNIFQREIVSYTLYDSEWNKRFGHDDDQDQP